MSNPTPKTPTTSTNSSSPKSKAGNEPKPARPENVPEAHAPALNRPPNSEKRSGAIQHAKKSAKENVSKAVDWLGRQCRKVQDTDPAAVASRTSNVVERASSETTNFLKTAVTTSVSFGAGVAIGLARGGPSGLSDKALERLRMRDGEGNLIEVASQWGVDEYVEDGVPKRRVYVQFKNDYLDLAPPIRADNSELPGDMASLPLELAYDITARDGSEEIPAYAFPLDTKDRETYGFLVLDRREGEAGVYAYDNA
jgi:hypothetical protein